jgi:hypothetical protein
VKAVEKLQSGESFVYRGKQFMRNRGMQRGAVFCTPMWEGSGLFSDAVYLPKGTMVEPDGEFEGLTKAQERET